MATRTDLKNECTLGEVANNIASRQHALLFGVIIDISEPFKYEDNDNYTTQLKIIDPSFNYSKKLSNKNIKFHKFIKVSIYTEVPENAPKIAHIGDIVRLRRFKFTITKTGQVVGSMQSFSNWLIYPGAVFKNDGVKKRD